MVVDRSTPHPKKKITSHQSRSETRYNSVMFDCRFFRLLNCANSPVTHSICCRLFELRTGSMPPWIDIAAFYSIDGVVIGLYDGIMNPASRRYRSAVRFQISSSPPDSGSSAPFPPSPFEFICILVHRSAPNDGRILGEHGFLDAAFSPLKMRSCLSFPYDPHCLELICIDTSRDLALTESSSWIAQ